MRTSLGIVVALLTACAPSVDGPIERQRANDEEDGRRLAAQLAALPGAITAHVVLHRTVDDPLAITATAVPANVGVLVVVDDRADRALVGAHVNTLVHAALPNIAQPTVVIELGASRPVLATVGPFTVERASRGPLRAVLAIALTLIAALAIWVAWRERYRRGNSAQ